MIHAATLQAFVTFRIALVLEPLCLPPAKT